MTKEKTRLDKIFEVSLILKGLDGVLELLGGFVLAFISPASINHIVRLLTQNELSENKHDFISTHIIAYSHHISSSTLTFGAIYLILHGIVKIVLVTAVLKEELWAYPWMMAFLIIFIIYQIYRLIIKYSFGLVLLTAFDIFIVVLTFIEYKKHKLRAEPQLTK
ncbi:MAG TPA: DUF2127 domain-containing protein [Patescibacteria group bacterium]|nr:DUF2127 domain-containing protein [Patescibacteria group bacterium]